MNIVIMGPQGCGKTTQADLLAKYLHVPHISTGEIYREITTQDSPLGRKVKDLLDRGQLIDDETTYEVVDKKLGEIKTGFVVDGFPRTLVQAQRNPFAIDHVVLVNLDDEKCIQRLLSRARYDDTRELISERLRLYHTQTEPILDYYRKMNEIVQVNGDQSIEAVHKDILQKLKII